MEIRENISNFPADIEEATLKIKTCFKSEYYEYAFCSNSQE